MALVFIFKTPFIGVRFLYHLKKSGKVKWQIAVFTIHWCPHGNFPLFSFSLLTVSVTSGIIELKITLVI
jgi:hypothetical protein